MIVFGPRERVGVSAQNQRLLWIDSLRNTGRNIRRLGASRTVDESEQENSAPWLLKEELRRLGSLLLRVAQAARVPLALDLTHLQQADADGIALLNALADAGAPLRGVSPYIALLLDRP